MPPRGRPVATGLGFANNLPGFACTSYLANYAGTIGNVETAEQVINGTIPSTSVANTTQTGLNFSGDGTGAVTLATTIPSRWRAAPVRKRTTMSCRPRGRSRSRRARPGITPSASTATTASCSRSPAPIFPTATATLPVAAARWNTTAGGCVRYAGHNLLGRRQLSDQPRLFPGWWWLEHGVLRRQGEQFLGRD